MSSKMKSSEGKGLADRITRLRRLLKQTATPSQGRGIFILLAILVVTINGVAIWGLIYSGRQAQEEVRKDLELQALAGARSLEAVLASTRADFLFLSQSPPIAGFRQVLEHEDPMVRRWRRLDIEATLLLFLTSHPEVERIVLFYREEPFLVAGRRDGAPVILPTTDFEVSEDDPERFVSARWGLGFSDSQGSMHSLLSVEKLLEVASPTQEYSLALHPTSELESRRASPPSDSVVVPVQDADWSPPIDWAIIWSEQREGLLESVGQLTERYRMTLAINLILLLLAAGIGIVSVRQARRGIALEVQNRQQAQILELERQLMHSERLASVGRLAAGLAHEINNPLEGMANYLSLLEEDIRRGERDSSLDFVAKIRQGVKRAAGVTRRTLSFAEPGAKPRKKIDLREVAQESVEFLSSHRLFREIDLQLELAREPLWILGNPTTLGQVFINLLLNAGEIQEGRGEIRIECESHGDRVRVLFRDRGPGVDPEDLESIFEPFFSKRDSTGLGLSICRSIIDQHDGEISARNRPGGGAIFTILLPRAAAQEEVSSSSAAAEPLEAVLQEGAERK